MSKRSAVWLHFEKTNVVGKAKCLTCGDIISCAGSTTTGMRFHAKLHNILFDKITNELPADAEPKTENNTKTNPTKKFKSDESNQTSMLSYIRKNSLQQILAKCAAKNGISIHQITSCDAIGGYVSSQGYAMPKSETSVWNQIHLFFEEKTSDLKKQIATDIKNGTIFSITVDEWSDIKYNKYLNITLNNTETHHVLGLAEIHGSCNASQLKNHIEKKLAEFGLNFEKHIAGSTHDGAAIMKKYGNEISAESQLCHNHGIHLAVKDLFYSSGGGDTDTESDDESYQDTDVDESLSDDIEIEVSNLTDDNNLNFENYDSENQYIPTFNHKTINTVLIETRKMIKKFKKSGVKNNILQTYIFDQEKKKLRLLLDCKTRWNSLVPMLERFIKLKTCLKKACEDLEITYNFDNNIIIIENLLKILKPLEIAVKELSKEDANLLTSEGVYKFMFDSLRAINTELSTEMIEILKNRMNERRNQNLMTLLIYLTTGTIPKSNNDFCFSSKTVVITYATNLMERMSLGENGYSDKDSHDTSSSLSDCDTDEENTLQKQLHASIASISKKSTHHHIHNIKTDLKLLEATKTRSSRLDKLYKAVITIRPTSTACERVFSVAGNFVTKIRSNLRFKSLNSLVFLKYYFLKNKN